MPAVYLTSNQIICPNPNLAGPIGEDGWYIKVSNNAVESSQSTVLLVSHDPHCALCSVDITTRTAICKRSVCIIHYENISILKNLASMLISWWLHWPRWQIEQKLTFVYKLIAQCKKGHRAIKSLFATLLRSFSVRKTLTVLCTLLHCKKKVLLNILSGTKRSIRAEGTLLHTQCKTWQCKIAVQKGTLHAQASFCRYFHKGA